MKKAFKLEIIVWCIILFFILISCNNKTQSETAIAQPSAIKENKTPTISRQLSTEFKNYWNQGTAEISSFKLQQARYGEIREGEAVLVYVTEHFLKDQQIKADIPNANNIPVLKLNTTKNFNTGIYPYSIMESTFYPINGQRHALKVSCSVQEWCGHVYTQLNNRDKFEISLHSYFESEGDSKFSIEKTHLENELWTALRVQPNDLPIGNIFIIPNLAYSRLKHVNTKAYSAKATLTQGLYTLHYPELKRTLAINFNHQAPYQILGWEETYSSGFGKNAQQMTTKATLLKRIKSDYWNKNHNTDSHLRSELQLN